MSEVKRYVHREEKMQRISKFYVRLEDKQYVLAKDFDAAQAEVAALREELAELSDLRAYATIPLRERCAERKALELKLTAAEQRNAELITALTYLRDTSDDWHVCEKAADALTANKCSSCNDSGNERVLGRDNSELVIDCSICTKPTESGASGQKVCVECEQPYCCGVCVERGDGDELE